MGTETALELINQQRWLDPLADALQLGIHQTFESAGEAGQEVKDALHGTWLGHPLHPAITDIPIGAWTAALVLDAVDEISSGNGFGKAADTAVAVGLVGAMASAVTGLADWSDTDGRARKMGLTHGLINLTSVALYGASFICRRNNDRATGRGLAAIGYALSLAAAWLGGELVYKEHVGTDFSTAGAALPEDWVGVCADADLPDNTPKRVDAQGMPVLLLRRDGRILAIAARCSHAGGPLDEGEISGNTVTCPWHKSQFDLIDGAVLHGPATHPQPCFEARLKDGQIEVKWRTL